MALVKARDSVTPALTATGQSNTIDVSASYRHEFYVRHTNGTGTITAGAVVVVQCQASGSSVWFNHRSIIFGTTASAVETRTVDLPDSAANVRLDYTVPTGSTGHSLDGEVGKVTSF